MESNLHHLNLATRNLEYKNLDWNELIERTASFATSDSAREEIRKTSHLDSAQSALDSVQKIIQASELVASGTRPHMESVDFFEVWHSRLRKNAVLKPLEIKDVRSFCLEVVALHTALENLISPWATGTLHSLMKADEPLSAIDQLLTPAGDIRMDASERLYALSKEKDQLSRQIQNAMDKIVKDNQMESMLQDRFVTTRDGRWVIPVKGGLKHFVPGVVHGSSQTKQTVFIEPEAVVPINNRLKQVEIEIEDEIERLLTDLSNYLYTLVSPFKDTREILVDTDVVLAKAQLAILLEAKAFDFTNEIKLNGLFHPLLKLSGKKPITNTIELNHKKSILLLSGPNAGGKTVLLKSIGLAAQMARCGFPICVTAGSSLPFFEKIQATIGDSQSVDEDLSTFAAHLKALNQSLDLSGSGHLILVDEICGSTDPEEGSALARAFIDSYSTQGVFAVITSHLSPLKQNWPEDSHVVNGSLEFNTQHGRPTYRYIYGIPGDSLAILTAQRVGVRADILKSANENLSPIAKKRLAELESIEKVKENLVQLQKDYEQKVEQFNKKNAELEKKISDFENRKELELQKTLLKASQKIETEISQIKAAEALDKHRKLQNIQFKLPEIVKAKPVQQANNAITSSEEFAARFPAGSKVYVPSLQQDGVVQSAPNSKGEVWILSNSLRLQIPWSDLKPAQKSASPTSILARQAGFTNVSLGREDRSLDLRGLTIDVALSKLESSLDLAVSQNEDRVKIIHGHGSSDTLKKAIRNFLSRSVYVRKWKSGSSESGGDGITWVEIGSD